MLRERILTALVLLALLVPAVLAPSALPFAFLVPALLGVLMDRTLYRRVYSMAHLDQVLFSIGLVFM